MWIVVAVRILNDFVYIVIFALQQIVGFKWYFPMKFKSLLLLLTSLVVTQVQALDYISTFTDEGNITVETRNFTDGSKEEWQWLDLTITNSLSFNSVAADLANDGSLNNSDNALVGLATSISDVTSLSAEEQTGWQAATDEGVVDLINAFFGLSLVDGQNVIGGLDSLKVEEFITTFGDTYHEGRDDAGFTSTDVNPSLPNIGFTQGITGTLFEQDIAFNEIVLVSDGQYFYETSDNTVDRIITTSTYQNDASGDYLIGTWLVRQNVDEPSTVVLFSLALMGLAARRFRQQK